MRYEVRVGQRLVRIERGLDGRFLIDERVVAIEATEVQSRIWSVTTEGRVHEVAVLSDEPLRLLVDGREIAAQVIDERIIAAAGAGARARPGRHEIRAPMPGILKAVHVREGDVVDQGDPLVTLEAMKMENELRAPARAKVARVAAQPATKVEGGALLVTLIETA